MLTIFTIPKRFIGYNRIIQTNAIKSWLQTCRGCQIILLGDDEGTAEVAAELGTLHIPNVERSERGTPLVSSMFSLAQSAAKHELICYVNADIILMGDFLSAVSSVHRNPFLMVGQRWDLDIRESLSFNDKEWESELRNRNARQGKLHAKSGIDYFVYSRGLYDEIPPFAIGRTTWDNWLIYYARARGAAVIDATSVVTAIHQNHDYSHDAGGETNVWKGPEAIKNRELAGGIDHGFTTEYATHLLTPAGLRPAISPRHIYFRMRAWPVLKPRLNPALVLFKGLERLVRSVRLTSI